MKLDETVEFYKVQGNQFKIELALKTTVLQRNIFIALNLYRQWINTEAPDDSAGKKTILINGNVEISTLSPKKLAILLWAAREDYYDNKMGGPTATLFRILFNELAIIPIVEVIGDPWIETSPGFQQEEEYTPEKLEYLIKEEKFYARGRSISELKEEISRISKEEIH